jgi:hypothetical protein
MQPAGAARVVGRALRPGYRVGDPIYLLHGPSPEAYPEPILSYLGVRYLLTREHERLGPPWVAAGSGPGGSLWRNPAALPLFFMSAKSPGAGEARIHRAGSNGFEIDIVSPTGGLVASSVAWSHGWRLRLDGSVAPVLRVNSGFLGFFAPPGTHRAVLDYRPDGWVWGLRLCGATLVALLAFGALPAAGRRGGRAAAQASRSPTSAGGAGANAESATVKQAANLAASAASSRRR